MKIFHFAFFIHHIISTDGMSGSIPKKMKLIVLIFFYFLEPTVCLSDDRPIIQDLLVSSRLVEGKKVYLTCQLADTGKLPVNFRWTHSGSLITPNDNVAIINSDESSQLIIKEMNLNSSGNYECKVENSYGFDSRQVDVKLNGRFIN